MKEGFYSTWGVAKQKVSPQLKYQIIKRININYEFQK
jgi:hypothetical protein